MKTFPEALFKEPQILHMGWRPESSVPSLSIASYKLYVSLIGTTGSMVLLYSNISPTPSRISPTVGKISQDVGIAEVRTALSLPSTKDFTNSVLYFLVTYVDTLGAESPPADSTISEVTPVGIMSKTMKEDPSINRHGYVFSSEIQKWVKAAGSASGAAITAASDFYKANITTDYTYDGTNVATMLSYPSDSTVAGSPAKLTTYSYSGGLVSKVIVTDSTV